MMRAKSLTQDQRLAVANAARQYSLEYANRSPQQIWATFPDLRKTYSEGEMEIGALIWQGQIRDEMTEIWADNASLYLAQSMTDGMNGAMSSAVVGYGLGMISTTLKSGYNNGLYLTLEFGRLPWAVLLLVLELPHRR